MIFKRERWFKGDRLFGGGCESESLDNDLVLQGGRKLLICTSPKQKRLTHKLTMK